MPLSYRLHAELAAEHGGEDRWGYRKIFCGSLEARGRVRDQANSKNGSTNGSVSLQKREKPGQGRPKATGLPNDLDWIAADTSPDYGEMGTPDNTAQVHPYQFTTSMARLAEEAGARIILGTASRIGISDERVESVTYTDRETSQSHTIATEDVVIAAGPWTQSLYPQAPIEALRAHSITIRPSKPISGYALFTNITLPPNLGRTDTFIKSKRPQQKVVSPEIYARPDNEAYACGEGDKLVPLPKTTDDVVTDNARCKDIVDYVSSISDELRDGVVTARQACYLPLGGPLIGETGTKGLLMASGHNCWGIQNGPATGKIISEFIFDGKAKSGNVSSLDPRKVM